MSKSGLRADRPSSSCVSLSPVGTPATSDIQPESRSTYADALILRGVIGRTGKVLGWRALVVLHDQEGHPLVVTTHRGDPHLTSGVPAILTAYEQATALKECKRIDVDREGMAAEFLAGLARAGREEY